MTRDLEVQVADSEAQGATVRIVHDYVPDDHVAMALVRAVNAACVQLGITPPGELFAQSSGEVLALRQKTGELIEQSAMITQALAEAGFEGRFDTGSMLTAIADLRHQGRVGGALGDGFPEALRVARESYNEVLTDLARPSEPAQVTELRAAALALGNLLAELRKIDPEPVRNSDGSTTVTLTEPVEIGTPEVSP